MKMKKITLTLLTVFVLLQLSFNHTLALNSRERVQSEENKKEKIESNLISGKENLNLAKGEELIEYRNETTKVFRNSDGTIKAEVGPGPIHYLKEDKWIDIDNTLVETSNGEYRNKNNNFFVSFPKRIEKNKAILNYEIKGHKIEIFLIDQPIGKENSKINFGLKSVEGEKSKYKIKYNSIYPNVSTEYILHGSKVKENIILHSYENKNVFEYFLKTNGGINYKKESGELIFTDARNGDFLFKFEKPFMYDSNIEGNTISYEINQDISSINDGYILKLEINEEYLKDPDRIYPVIIDPVINDVYNNGDTYISQNESTTNYSNNQFIHLGGMKRALIKWTLPEIPMDIKSASIGIAPTYETMVNYPINIHKVTSPYDTNTVTWNSQPAYSSKIEGIVNGVSYDQYNHFDITNLVKEWHLEPSKNYGVLLKYSDINEIGTSSTFLSSEYINNPLWNETWVYPEPGPKLTIEYTPTQGTNQYIYDSGGRLKTILLSNGGSINYYYDLNGNLIIRNYLPN